MRDKTSNKGGSRKNRESKGAGTPTSNMAYDYRAPSNELFPTSVQANLRLPTGRPYLTRSRKATSSNRTVFDMRNQNVPSVQRIRLYASFADSLAEDKFSINEWINYAVQQMYTGLRVSNRSNVGYSVQDLKEYLVQIITLYAYTRAAVTHMMCYNMSDPRVPGLQTALCCGLNNDLMLSDESSFVARADDVEGLPDWMQNIQDAWSRAKLAADQLATLPIPRRIKVYLDYLLSNIFVDQKVGGQYYKIDLSVSPATQFPWVTEAVSSQLEEYFYQNTNTLKLWKPLAQIATALSGPTATLNTMVSDLRRLEGMVPCTIDIPSDFGALPNIVADDDMFFDTIDNTCFINLAQLFARSTLTEGYPNGAGSEAVAGEAVMPSPEMGEIRVDATHSLDDPARLAMITSLMSVSTDLNGGTINFGMSPLVYGGTTYFHMDWQDNGLTGEYHEEYLIVIGRSYGTEHQYESIYGDWYLTGVNQGTPTMGKEYRTYDFVPFANVTQLLNLSAMEHHPMYPVVFTPTAASTHPQSDYTAVGYREDAFTKFHLLKVLKEGTRVSIGAIRDIQFYAWASLLRL